MSEKRGGARGGRTDWEFWRRKEDAFGGDVSGYVQAGVG